MKVKCINNSICPGRLTIGKIYNVFRIIDYYYDIYDNNNIVGRWFHDRFKKLCNVNNNIRIL